MKIGAVLVLPLVLCTAGVLGSMRLVHRWKTPEFKFPSEASKQALTASGNYVPNTGYILDVDVDRRGRMFLTHPLFANGTTVTLSTVSNPRQVDDPLLEPYPSWNWHLGRCDGFTSVFRIKIDKCNRLWVLDTGVVDVFDSFNRACPPRLLVFDLNRDRLIRRHDFPDYTLESDSLFITVDVETNEICRDTFAYVADVVAYKMIVYSMENDRSWQVNSSAFYNNPNFDSITVSGTQFELQDGLFGLTVSPRISNNDHLLFFHALASNCESMVRTSALKNEGLLRNDPNAVNNRIASCFGRRRTQSSAEAMDSNGNLFSANVTNNAIDCWNWNKRFAPVQAAKSDDYFQFISGMKVVPSSRGDQLWAISCKFQLFVTTGLDRNEYNFHVTTGSTEELARSSGCQNSWTWNY